MIFNDPFSLVYSGLWALIDRNNDIDKLVPKGNRIRFDDVSYKKKSISNADLPELSLFRSTTVYSQKTTKDSTNIIAGYQWSVATGNYSIQPVFNPLTFEIFRSLMDWECTLCPLMWCGCNFVENCIILDSDEGTSLDEQNQQIPGWASILRLNVEMVFSRSSLKLKV